MGLMFFIGELCPIESGRSYKPSLVNGSILFLKAFEATQFCSHSIEIKIKSLKRFENRLCFIFFLFIFI